MERTLGEIRELFRQKSADYYDSGIIFSRAYLLNLKHNTHQITIITEPEKASVDRTDIEILRLIVPNARIQIIEIASKLKLTPKTVISRIKNLEKNKVIAGYKTFFDLEKLGYQYFKIHFRLQNVTKEKERQFRNYIKSHPNIIYDDEVLGGDDFEIEAQVTDLPELRKLINQIKTQFAEIIKQYKIMTYYKEHKYLFLPAQL